MDVWSRLRQSLALSDRELQIVQGIFEDHKQETIAFNLGISPHSVNTYIQRIYGKLRIGSRPQLIVRVVSEYLGLVACDAQVAAADCPDVERLSCSDVLEANGN
jgi:DNA-binding CsgD family transcriptional regulator